MGADNVDRIGDQEMSNKDMFEDEEVIGEIENITAGLKRKKKLLKIIGN